MKLRQRPITTIALTGGLMAVGALGGVGTAGAAKRMEVALQDEPVFLQQAYGNRDRALRQARDLQVTRLRANVQWAKVLGSRARSRSVPSRLTYDWAQYDSLINAAAAYGIRVEFALTGPAPAWATANRRVGPFKPNARRYASFVEAAAKHFEGRVDRYLIWNEPNYIGWLAPLSRGPRLYRSLYKAG
jgi:beta-glucosidase/6-phospho-beta-glucosidase/beta-galactosidase